MKVLITQPKNSKVFETFFTPKVIKEIEKLGEITFNPYNRAFTKEELQEELKGIEIVFTGWGVYTFDEFLLGKADKLKIIAHVGGSVAAIYSEELIKRNILVLSGNKIFAEMTAEGTLCYILMAQRKMIRIANETIEYGWPREYINTKSLKKKTVGIIGFGMTAKYLVRFLSVFDVKIKVYSGYLSSKEAEKYKVELCSLDEIFKTCDIVSVHSGLNDKNYHLIGKKHLEMMKDDSLIVNTARGAIINEAEMAKVLKQGRIRAVLDVYEEEPLPMNSELRGLDNVLLLPHKAGVTTEIREEVTLALLSDIEMFLSGKTDLEFKIDEDYAKYMSNGAKYR